MSIRIAVTALLIASLGTVVQGEEKKWGDRFRVPEQGHIEFLHCFNCEVQGLKLETEGDVLKLHQQIANIPFDEELITSFKLLENLGFEKIERSLPPPPSGAKGPITILPDWRESTFDFTPERLVERQKFQGHEFIYAETPASDLMVTRSPNSTQATHSIRDEGATYYKKDVKELLSRSAAYKDAVYQIEPRGELELCVATMGQTTMKFLSQPERDLIAARFSEHRGQVFGATLHFYPRQPEDGEGIWLPRLTCTIIRKPEGKCKLLFSIIRLAEFDKLVDPDALKVPIQRGERYVWGDSDARYAVKMPIDIDDIADKTPLFVRELINLGEKN